MNQPLEKSKQIAFKQFGVINIDYSTNQLDKNLTNDLEVNFQFGSMRPDESDNQFLVYFEVEFISKQYREFVLKVKAVGEFECISNLDDEFMESDFVEISAPAIVFPYLRAFISNLTLSIGFDPITFPTVDFVALAKRKRSADEEEQEDENN